jgi:hypothetical protein
MEVAMEEADEEMEEAELEAFIEYIRNLKEEYENTPKTRIMNPIRRKAFMDVLNVVYKIVKAENRDAKVTFQLNDAFDMGHPSITVEDCCLDFKNVKALAAVLQSVRYITVIPLTSGNVSIDLDFPTLYDTLSYDEGDEE